MGQIAARNTIGMDAFNAVSTIPDVSDVRIEAEDDERADISFIYTSNDNFRDTKTHLSKFYLAQVSTKEG